MKNFLSFFRAKKDDEALMLIKNEQKFGGKLDGTAMVMRDMYYRAKARRIWNAAKRKEAMKIVNTL